MFQPELITLTKSNELNKDFETRYKNVISDFFSRDSGKWPILNHPKIQVITQFRKTTKADFQQLYDYHFGKEHFTKLTKESHISQHIIRPEEGQDNLLLFASALCKNWENPLAVENVVAMPSDPAIYGAMLGLLGNPNMVHCEYSGFADNMEKAVIRKMANLFGYDADKASGLFTQGGTMCNLYGYLFGIRKSLKLSKEFGMSVEQDFRIINSQAGHYSNMTNLSLLGVDIKNKTIRICVTPDNKMDMSDLEKQIRACYTVNCKVPVILLTAGITDTFGVDEVKQVYDIRERLCKEFNIIEKPHIHVDAAVGWPILFFIDYDFATNPLAINDVTLKGLHYNTEKFKQLKYADSVTVDFHKWGYVPYTSSLIMVRNGKDFNALKNASENFTYFENIQETDTHLQSTIECSRSGVGIFGAYAGLHYLGIEGYQIIIAHCLQNANYMRNRLMSMGNACVIAPGNQGPNVGFRIYSPKNNTDPQMIFERELTCSSDKVAYDIMTHNSRWHRELFLRRGKTGLYTNWVGAVVCSMCPENRQFIYIPGEKAVFMNPVTQRHHIDKFIDIITKMSTE
ncbi:TPA: aspartate aminotransferase family protein [Salmonella enterica]|nr:aspartate aminotransferase family protein [Salmonella enterica]